jgi:hypothetical protein
MIERAPILAGIGSAVTDVPRRRATDRTAAGASESPDDGRPDVTVVMPCLNEAASVGECVDEAFEAMRAAGIDGEVVVVDNGSTDESAEIAAARGARVIVQPTKGYGAALLAGFRGANGRIVVMADADCTYPLDKIPELIAPIVAGEADIVCGGRLEAANRHNMPLLHRYIGTPTLTFIVGRACGGLTIRDSQSGFRAFRRASILELDLRSPGMELASEMVIKAAQRGFRINEIPTGYRPRVGESKLDTLSDGWRHLRTILLLAPELLLLWPGAALALLGIGMTTVGFVSPTGVSVGSLRWQPVFFSSIALIAGVLGVLTGMILARRSALASEKVHDRFAWLEEARTATAAMKAGVFGIASGFVIEGALSANWFTGHSAPSRGLVLASVAQSLILIGLVIGVAGLLGWLALQRSNMQPVLGVLTDDSVLVGVDPDGA